VDSYSTIDGCEEYVFEVNRSKFIAVAQSVDSEEEAGKAIESVKKKYPAATHYCFAYTLSPQENIKRFSDDGEPRKTAGMPILEAITGKNLYSTLVVVARYFGGTKLGTGGLVRAYSAAASKAIEKCGTSTARLSVITEVKTDYPYFEAISKAVSANGGISDPQFGDYVKLTACLPVPVSERILGEIKDISAGTAEIKIIDKKYCIYKQRLL